MLEAGGGAAVGSSSLKESTVLTSSLTVYQGKRTGTCGCGMTGKVLCSLSHSSKPVSKAIYFSLHS